MTMAKEKEGDAPTLCERKIWKFYEWAVIVAPILIMLSHWYIFYVFSKNTHELMHYSEANEICIAWIYSILYLYVPLMILPASYFFKWCNLFRVPFVYFVFINVERWCYGSWFCTNEMVKTHYVLIYCICAIYVMELIQVILSNYGNIKFMLVRIRRNVSVRVRWWLREARMRNDAELDVIAKMMKEESV